jgi:hypothetical protein
MIVDLFPSPLENKKYRAGWIDKNGKIQYIDFGSSNSTTYVEGASRKQRSAYWARHFANSEERRRITNLIPSAALLSAYILWGNSTDLTTNLHILNNLIKSKH